MRRSLVLALGLAVAAAAFVGCVTTEQPPAGTTVKVTFKAFIDGSDTVKIKGSELWYIHHTYQMPGMWNSAAKPQPTIVNGTEWHPGWKGAESDRYGKITPPLPSSGDVTVHVVKGHKGQRVDVAEQPSAKNDYTASILIDDDPQDGPRWYDFSIAW